ncbi:SMC-Scp complex subunit ScpB [Shewanella sp. Choline-02u-19]|uniref:SMC-Scp complex subunit ScpB n=1 Tax=Shewanella TaxID=22 RepID=UPI000C34CAFA|nr:MULTISPECIES: SMC-Scp complex subunit ScpB [Shewanella]MCL1059893.1 SMC-Scp complex subunit ScpB [Shewanella gelidimarina]PKG58850.1 SMC-Scp complex subunit ScpB [Shewanella sp. GutDb-MelDb]PKG74162.1 SMC-Scp complex subunit ScpB [Shewanella sp. GutCb]PKH55822.1 SMC-Scp complex subunit ScpB [Shewanella sp. Bg11-22]PKI27185.1 SMC-Scp complex subunit ScpB [Shewanella sp. Choline-02u-19]
MSQINPEQLKQLIEASLFVLAKPMTIKALKETVLSEFSVSRAKVQASIDALQLDYEGRGVQLVKVAGGYRFQTLVELSPYLQPLWQEKAPKYSRATIETLAVIAYRQPVTRGDIEFVRGVAISSHIIKSLNDRNWIKVVGHKEVPGRPALYATTIEFLSYFGLDSITELPSLSDPESLDALFSTVKSVAEKTEESTNE